MINTKIPIYGIMIVLSIIVNIIIIIILSLKQKINKKEILCSLIYENIGIIFGAKILTYVTNYDKLSKDVNLLSVGLSSYGAVIGGIVFLALYCMAFRKSLKEVYAIFIVPIPLMYALGKIGCFFAGCCYGIMYNGIGSVVYNYSTVAPNGIGVFPVQLLETIIFTGIFFYTIFKIRKNENIEIISNLFIICGISKFILDYFRISHENLFLSINQVISIIFIIVGIIMIVKAKNKESKNN